ncbi:HlyD family secretion protein [Hyphomicrobium sp.]|uniref:HlyD family secretion protein n=1 Tax=Hyphomicrobium sp. TaxID=82 RepID=UPI002E3764D7|nr:HlyD family secretion protein [Hyphomicrobium sp.]HEX2841642.1 HlyD family secretion protein [Hyphomicrobium sp.]
MSGPDAIRKDYPKLHRLRDAEVPSSVATLVAHGPAESPEGRVPQPAGPEGRSAEAPNVKSAAQGAPPAPKSRKKLLLGALGAVLLSAGLWYGYHYITVGRFIVSTDDAYVGADMAIMSPKVAANVAEVPIVENQAVKEGDVLVRLDSGDYQLALDQANSKLATQRAAIRTFGAQIRAAEATETQMRAQLEATKANVAKTEADYERTKPLADRDFTSKATLDAAIAARDTARAQAKAGEAAIQTAGANIALLKSQREQAEQVAKELEVSVAKAERDLSFTVIRAPFDGVVGNRGVQVGDYVTPGKRLLAIVPLDKVYVDANVKETQLPGIKAGDTAELSVDALDGPPLKGVVESIAPASGSRFSLLPPENATGNFTKIVQRVPVRIAVPTSEAHGRLRPGLSVVVDIDTRTAPKDRAQQTAERAQ